jgi:hypothetical protein
MPMNPRLLRPIASGVHPEAAAWRTAVVANGGSVSASTMRAVSKFCADIDKASIRDRFYRLNLFAGTGLNAALVPLYRATSFGGSALGNATDTNNAFVSGDYSESVGLQKNVNASKYLDTGLAPEDFPSLATGHLSAYRGAGAASVAFMVGSRSSTQRYEITKRGDSRHHGGWGGTTNTLANSEPTHEDAGLISVSRTSATSLSLYYNSTLLSTITTSVSPGTSEYNLFVFGVNNAGVFADGWAPNAVSFISIPLKSYSIGDGMDAGQMSAFSAAIAAFQTALGRA